LLQYLNAFHGLYSMQWSGELTMTRSYRRYLRAIPMERERLFGLLVLLIYTATAEGFIMQSADTASTQGSPPPPAARMIDLQASDGTVLKASYFAAVQPGPGVLLFHQTNRSRKAWDVVAGQLAAAGINTLTLDLRGFGESGGKAYDKLTDKEIAEARGLWPGDIESAWQFLIAQPSVKRDVIGLGGGGYDGVDNSVQTARRHPEEVKSLVLLSGETFLPGLQFLRHSPQLPGLFVVADDDEYPPTVDAMELLYNTSSNPGKKLVHYAGERAPWKWYELYEIGTVPATGSHGTDMFEKHPELPGIIVDWFVSTLIKTPGQAAADTVASAPILDQLERPGGAARVAQQLTEARRKNPKAQLFPEVALDILGSDHLRAGEAKVALAIFKLNLVAYPESADAHTDLAEAYLADGQNDLARRHAEKALALLDSHAAPASSWSDSEPKRSQIRRGAQRILNRLSAAH
jgi:pimeloyl-ACP methyl ester carboxylesterase